MFFTNGHYVADLTPSTRSANARNAQIVVLQIGSRKLTIVNHHAHWEITPLGSAASVARMELLRSIITDLPGPLILAGDLNVDPDTATMHVFDGLLEDLTATYTIASTLSVLGKVPNVACDHVLVSDAIAVRDFRVLDDLVSDHKALVLDFDIG